MKKGFYCDKDGEILLITENESNNFEVKSNNELFKQALVEGVNRHIDKTIGIEKQIEEMARTLCGEKEQSCAECESCYRCEFWHECSVLHHAGYRKQNVGEWVRQKGSPEAICSECGRDVVYQVIDNKWAFENFCPNCGSKMKGVEQ